MDRIREDEETKNRGVVSLSFPCSAWERMADGPPSMLPVKLSR